MDNSVSNFYKCLSNHPEFKLTGSLLIIFTPRYESLGLQIAAFFTQQNSMLRITTSLITIRNSSELQTLIQENDFYLIFYDNDYAAPAGQSEEIRNIASTMKKHWINSCVLKNMGDHFNEAFGVSPKINHLANHKLIELAKKSQKFIYKDDSGSYLEANISSAKWIDVSCTDKTRHDVVPGEIGTHAKFNGSINFIGTFLSVVPFAARYKVLDTPLTLEFSDNKIIKVTTDNQSLYNDFMKYITFNPSNAQVEELGIGTSTSVTQLYGINAAFEERHVGLHLGLGGGQVGSDHLDLICQSGSLYFDDILIIQNRHIVC